MKKNLFKLALAVFVALGFEAGAWAQFGLLNSISKAVKEAKSEELHKLGIPQVQKNGKTATFTWGGTPIGTWNPQTLEILFNQKWDEGELAGQYVIYKIDPETGEIVRNDGVKKGQIYADGSFDSPNLGALRVDGVGRIYYKDGEQIGHTSSTACWCFNHQYGEFNYDTPSQVMAVVYLGLLTAPDQVAQWKAEYQQQEAEEAARREQARIRAEEQARYEREHPTFYDVQNRSGKGYVDSNGVVYDWAKNKIGQLPKGDGDILDKYGNRIGSVSFGGQDIKDRSGKLVATVNSGGFICDGDQPHVSIAAVETYGYVVIKKDASRLGQCDCRNYLWTTILVYCDFFRF